MKKYIVAYDIADKKRLARVRKIAYSYALGGQKSVLEAPLNAKLLKELTEKLNQLIDPSVDRINIIEYANEPLCFGTANYLKFENGVIVIWTSYT